ncbi:transcriptional regulator [Streptacidiphilus jiangxiensis]|uniref:TENA/THI-4/PQQC family protein n=1 Tax=Streptacidiphilus jiangxiensis TaxID=235985 RepID=A0A1H7TNT1_STRJI|nr:transcriptional regulator [Streptacidiphilus jiangxiensis]SEL86114.1 TENA/THI-4/PQQC family protein [Streptacidiphilus jiangxiensis]
MTTQGATDLLARVREELAPGADENRLIERIGDGSASLRLLGGLAAQQRRIIASDRRSFLVLAARCADAPAGAYFAELAAGESQALGLLAPFAAACGLNDAALRAHPPLAGCQAYPAYLAWLALNGEPAGVVLALTANFAAWGGYCATVSTALRTHYGFDDRACAFFDFFATPDPDAEARALAVVEEWQARTDAAANALDVLEYGRLLQTYELMFWNTLAGEPVD